jgi:hypothetical protein
MFHILQEFRNSSSHLYNLSAVSLCHPFQRVSLLKSPYTLVLRHLHLPQAFFQLL